jgi:hypothetical protein
MKSPIITRKTSQRHVREAVAEAKAAHDSHVQALIKAAKMGQEEQRREWDTVTRPILQRMVEVSGQRRPESSDFVLHFNLDRRMVEQAAMTNDRHIWRYIAEMVGRHVENELSTMNFAGLHKLAADFERRYRRPSYALPPMSSFDRP